MNRKEIKRKIEAAKEAAIRLESKDPIEGYRLIECFYCLDGKGNALPEIQTIVKRNGVAFYN